MWTLWYREIDLEQGFILPFVRRVLALILFYQIIYFSHFSDPADITLDEANPSTITEGGDAQLTCTADANPQPSDFVSWTRNGNTVEDEYASGTSVVTLSSIDRTQAGRYVCEADNGVGTSDTRSVDVTVHCKY